MAKKNSHNRFSRTSLKELKGRLEHAMNWMIDGKGRFQKLLDINAPIQIITNERNTWDKMVATVRDIIADGRLILNDQGNAMWRDALMTYFSLPHLDDILPGLTEKYEQGKKELMQKLKEDGLSDDEIKMLEKIPV